jgi:hypothetical protein
MTSLIGPLQRYFSFHFRGLSLCGLGADGVDLLQRYLDRTGDIQSVCWIAVRCIKPEMAVGTEEQGRKDCFKLFETQKSLRLYDYFLAITYLF